MEQNNWNASSLSKISSRIDLGESIPNHPPVSGSSLPTVAPRG
jgi:hypothetical protein